MTINDLLARAVADSADRPTWLAARAGGVTATEVAELDEGGPAFRRNLADSKRTGEELKDIGFIRAIAYGRLREAPLGAWVSQRFGIQANTILYHATNNSRHLATPDGTGVNFDDELMLSEIKTTSIPLETPPKKYLKQMLWQCIVTGAGKVLFVWELHNNDWSKWPKMPPQPIGDPHATWYTVADLEKMLGRTSADLIATADEFLELLDGSTQTPEVDANADEMERLGGSILFHRDAESLAKKAKEKDWADLNKLLAERAEFAHRNSRLQVSWAVATTSVPVVDFDAAKLAAPELMQAVVDANALADELKRVTAEQVKALNDATAAAVAELTTAPAAAWSAHLVAFTTTKTVTSPGKLTVTAVKVKETK